ncbi:MAG: IS701 family transposase [Chloroflexi bacterium]|nr:IS701 family transposase [Chloroflexota bacterium]
MMSPAETPDVFDAARWGLPDVAVADLADRLVCCWSRFRGCFQTQTRDPSGAALPYLRGLLTMATKRTYANIARRVLAPTADGQNLQYFMSESPWSMRAVVQQVQDEIQATPALAEGGVLLLDESADEKASAHSAGTGRQHNGRLGKVEMSQVGTFIAFYKDPVWVWVDGELFLQEHWFTPAMAAARQRVGVPPDRQFATKVQLGWIMIQCLQARGLSFAAVACDDLYGRAGWFRRAMDQAGIIYMADVPATTQVYLAPPCCLWPPLAAADHVEPPDPALAGAVAVEVRAVAQRADTVFQPILVRHTERGALQDPFAMRRVWTLHGDAVAEEWLVIRRHSDGRLSYALSNAPADTPHEQLAWLKCVRYFVERTNQDAKSEAGWDELQAQKYRAWEHHLALVTRSVVTWFVAQTKLEWAQTYARDPELARQLEVVVPPALSMANVRELLQAVWPLHQLTPAEAQQLVVNQLINRARSTRSRLKAQSRSPT